MSSYFFIVGSDDEKCAECEEKCSTCLGGCIALSEPYNRGLDSGGMWKLVSGLMTPGAEEESSILEYLWSCCGVRHFPLSIKTTDKVAFAVDGNTADLWEFDDKEAYGECDFSRAKQIVADASGKAVVAAAGLETVRYFSSKKGMLGNACAVDEWPLRLEVHVKEGTTKGIKYRVRRKKSCNGVGKENRRGRTLRRCKRLCSRMKSPGMRYCYAYQFNRKKRAPKRCVIFTEELSAPKVTAGPATSICYIKAASVS